MSSHGRFIVGSQGRAFEEPLSEVLSGRGARPSSAPRAPRKAFGEDPTNGGIPISG